MTKTITKVFVKETYENTMSATPQVSFEFGVGGTIPGILIDFEDGDKILMIAPEAPVFSFRRQVVNFKIEDYAYNEKLKRWDLTNTRSFDNNVGMVIDNHHLVNKATGEDREIFFHLVDDLTRPILDVQGQTTGLYHKKEELIDPTTTPVFVGEFVFWFDNMGKTILVPPIQATMEEYFLKKFVDPVVPVEPTPEPTPEPAP